MSWQAAVETAVKGLGYELVDAEKSAGGLLRVFIDHPDAASGADAAETSASATPSRHAFYETESPAAASAAPPLPRAITVDDCERVTRQLQHVLEVEGCDYQRLEVSSPGLDRPLKKVGDYRRFAGEQVELTLKLPLQGRKKYRGELQALGDAWRLILPEGGGVDATQRVLDFEVAEVREARLVPVLDFKGRRLAAKGAAGSEPAAGQGSSTTADGAKRGAAAGRSRAGEKTDGGGIQ